MSSFWLQHFCDRKIIVNFKGPFHKMLDQWRVNEFVNDKTVSAHAISVLDHAVDQ